MSNNRFSFEEMNSEGKWTYYQVLLNDQYLGDVSVNKAKKCLGRVPSGDSEFLNELSDELFDEMCYALALEAGIDSLTICQ